MGLMGPCGSKCAQMGLKGSNRSERVLLGPIGPDGSRWIQMGSNLSEWIQSGAKCQNWYILVHMGQKGSNGSKVSKLIQMALSLN